MKGTYKMSNLFEQLLRSNFRCGRMLNSRTLDLAGWAGMCAARSVVI